jgi:hypothetical protein
MLNLTHVDSVVVQTISGLEMLLCRHILRFADIFNSNSWCCHHLIVVKAIISSFTPLCTVLVKSLACGDLLLC